MKNSLLIIVTLIISFTGWSQNYDPVKTLVMLNQISKAKADLDKAFTNTKYTSKPEAYILKTAIYSSSAGNLLKVDIGSKKEDVIQLLGQPNQTSKTTTSNGITELFFYDGYTINFNEKGVVDWINEVTSKEPIKTNIILQQKATILLNEADASFTKYRELDASLSLINEPIYQNGIIMLYSNFYTFGYNDYNNKLYDKGLEKLKKAIFYSDLLIKQKVLTSTLDTNVLILAAITAETGGFTNEAAAFYTKLADAKVGGDGYEGVYRYLVTYHFGRKDMESFEKRFTLRVITSILTKWTLL
jgi:hypothetical protein